MKVHVSLSVSHFLLKNQFSKSKDILSKFLLRTYIVDNLDLLADTIVCFEMRSYVLPVILMIIVSEDIVRNKIVISSKRMSCSIVNPLYTSFYVSLNKEKIGIL